MEEIRNPDADFTRLSEQIRFDPGITMNILKIVNSAHFSGAQRVDSLQQAMVRLGTQRLFHIIVAQGVASLMTEKLAGYDLEPRALLSHSIGVALAAENLARHLAIKDDGALFTAGLLHDMGKVVLNPFVIETRVKFDSALRADDRPFDILEKEILGITHAEAGAELMRHWNFPEDMVEIVAWHHDPDQSKKQPQRTLMIHLADTLVYSQGVGDGIDGFRYRVHDQAGELLGLRPSDVERIASGVLDPLHELESIM